MDPKIWGESAWMLIHLNALNYEPTKINQQKIYNFYSNLIVPCNTCQTDYDNYLKDHPLTGKILSSNATLNEWLVNYKNKLNKKIGKSENDFDTIKKIYKEYTDEFGKHNDDERWEEIIWVYLYLVALNYPDDPIVSNRNKYFKFYSSLVFPCSVCQASYETYLKKSPITEQVLSNKKALCTWLATYTKTTYDIVRDFYASLIKNDNK